MTLRLVDVAGRELVASRDDVTDETMPIEETRDERDENSREPEVSGSRVVPDLTPTFVLKPNEMKEVNIG